MMIKGTRFFLIGLGLSAFLVLLHSSLISLHSQGKGTTEGHLIQQTCTGCHRGGRLLSLGNYTQNPSCRECHVPEEDRERVSSLTDDEEELDPQEKKRQEEFVNTHVLQPGDAPIIEQEMVLIPGGPFLLGNNGRVAPGEGPGDADERPAHPVYIPGYFIDKYEVTNAQYERFVRATGHRLPKHWKKHATFPAGKANHPVTYVDWYDADSYCRWAGKRLPTEPEWEKAARGTDGRAFPWGNKFDPKKGNTPQYWLSLNIRKGDTMPVGSFPEGRSPYGVFDMSGNVYEWTSSWYKAYPGNRVFNAHYGEKNRVLRGGSWYDCLSYGCGLSSPTYNRTRFNPLVRNRGFGFRCAKSESS